MRVLFAVLAAALVLAACSDTPTDPTGTRRDFGLSNVTLYCPGPFTMIPATKDPTVNHNGDEFICEMLILADDNVTVVATYVDNNVPVDQGACPEGFDVLSTKFGSVETDRNGDGWICRALRPNKNEVLIDNRFEVEKGDLVVLPPKG
jgi:hypothetical protein